MSFVRRRGEGERARESKEDEEKRRRKEGGCSPFFVQDGNKCTLQETSSFGHSCEEEGEERERERERRMTPSLVGVCRRWRRIDGLEEKSEEGKGGKTDRSKRASRMLLISLESRAARRENLSDSLELETK